MDFTTNDMIKLLLIVRYKFGYTVPNIVLVSLISMAWSKQNKVSAVFF